MIKDWFAWVLPKTTSKRDSRRILERAEQGDADAQFVMGLQLSSGKEQDHAQAAHWYRQAAVQNHLLAQYNLSIMLARGQGIGRNDQEAAGWLSRAAYGGDAGAQFQMGNLLSRADSHHSAAEANEALIEAYKWFQLAAAQGYKASVANSERLSYRMTRQDVTQGNQRVESFVPTLAASGTC